MNDTQFRSVEVATWIAPGADIEAESEGIRADRPALEELAFLSMGVEEVMRASVERIIQDHGQVPLDLAQVARLTELWDAAAERAVAMAWEAALAELVALVRAFPDQPEGSHGRNQFTTVATGSSDKPAREFYGYTQAGWRAFIESGDSSDDYTQAGWRAFIESGD